MYKSPMSFPINIDAKVDFRAKTNLHYGHYHHNSNGTPVDNKIVLVNMTHGMCCVGNMESFDGGCSYHFSHHATFGVRDLDGLQFFCNNTMQWRYFDDSVQQAYAQFALEKAIK